MRRHVAIAIALLSFSAGLHAESTAAERELAELRLIAQQRYLDGDFDTASSFYVELGRRLEAPADRAEALLTAAWLEELAARPHARDELLDRVLELAPESTLDAQLYSPEFEQAYGRARERYSNTRVRQAAEHLRAALDELAAGQRATARVLLDRALELTPDNPRVLYNLALLDLGDGRYTEAAAGFEAVLEACCKIDGKAAIAPLAHTGMGHLHYRQGRWAAAAESFAAAVQLDPAAAAAWQGLGLAQMQSDELAAAAHALERATTLAPEDPRVARHHAAALQRDDRPAEAVAALERALLRHPGDPDLLLELGVAQVALGNAEDARSALAAAESSPDAEQDTRSRAALHLAMVQFERGLAADARAAAERAVDAAPESAQGWNLLGLSRQAEGDLDGAADALTAARELDPGRAEILNNLGGVYADQGEMAAAERAYVQALTLDPTLAEARDGLRQVREWRTATLAALESPAVPRPAPSAAARSSRPVRPKQVGLRFVDLDYERLRLRGALVREVAKRSPAARAGLRRGDLVLRVDGYDIENDRDFFDYLRRNPPVEEMEVDLLRDGRERRFTLELAALR